MMLLDEEVFLVDLMSSHFPLLRCLLTGPRYFCQTVPKRVELNVHGGLKISCRYVSVCDMLPKKLRDLLHYSVVAALAGGSMRIYWNFFSLQPG